MSLLVISSSPSQVRPPSPLSQLRPPPPPSQVRPPSPLSQFRPPPPPSQLRPPSPPPPPSQLCHLTPPSRLSHSMASTVAGSTSPPLPTSEPPDPDFGVASLVDPPDPPVPPDRSLHPPFPDPRDFSQTSSLKTPPMVVTKNGVGGGSTVSVSDTPIAYGLLSPVLYMSLCGIIVWFPFSPSPIVLAQIPSLKTPPMVVTKDGDGGGSPCVLAYMLMSLHGKLSSLIYSATVEWPRQLSVCVKLNLRFMTFAGDIPVYFVSFGSTYMISSSIYFALAQYSAVCSPLTGPIPGVGVVFVLSFWWQVKERFIVIFSPMFTDMASHDYPFIPRSNQSSVLLFPPIWSELDVHASLVLQGSSSLRMFSAYGAVCVVLWVTLDSIFEEAYDVVVIQSHLVFFYDLYRHSIFYVIVVVIVYLAVNSLFVSSSNGV